MTDLNDEFDTDVKTGEQLMEDRPRTNLRIAHLDERVILIFPREIKDMPSKKAGQKDSRGRVIPPTYQAVFADLIITANEPLTRKLRDEAGVDRLPFVAENFMFTSWQPVTNLKNKIGSAKGVLVLVNSRPNQDGGYAYGIEPYSAADLEPAVLDGLRKAKALYLDQRKNDEFDVPVQDDDPPF